MKGLRPLPTMRTNFIILALMATAFVGCDYGRSGRYRLSLQPPAAASQPSNMQTVEDAIRAMLSARGYSERAGVWDKAGAHVSLKRSENGDLAAFVGSFGGKDSYRESEHTELALLRLVTAYPNIKVVREVSPHETASR